MIREIDYQTRLGDVYLFVYYLIKKGLNTWIQLEIIRERSGGIRELLKDPKIWIEEKRPKEEIIQKIEDEIYKTNTAKVKNYKKWVMNYGLVMFCSIFDQFLLELVESILDKNPQLCMWNTKQEILTNFEHRNIKEKKIIITNKLKISEKEFFDFTAFVESIQKQFKGFGFQNLFEIYEMRDKASHTDSYLLTDLKELEEIKELFEKLIFILSKKARTTWNAESQMVKLFTKNK